MKRFLSLLSALAVTMPCLPIMGQDKSPTVSDPYPGWQYRGEIALLTTAEGANLPASTSVEYFPLLVRLRKDNFDFRQAKSHGEDIRFSTMSGTPLAFQTEEWNASKGQAIIWVRIPKIEGNARQLILMHWGKSDTVSESNAKAVFQDSNGYLSVWHMNDVIQDEAGTLESKDVGTAPAQGVIGARRHFAGKQGIFGGEKITAYPSADRSHSTEAWFRAERSNATIIGWGNEGGGRGTKVRMQPRSPPHPVFTLKAPTSWNGRETLEVVPQVSNLRALQDSGAGELKTEWNVSGIAVIKEVTPQKLILHRAQQSGAMTVSATMHNGGQVVTQRVVVAVQEPEKEE
ncbi:hypothetical protein BH11VER1_BH11VER1_24080 [soil metagenome]